MTMTLSTSGSVARRGSHFGGQLSPLLKDACLSFLQLFYSLGLRWA
jgi:hypothetical protein